MSRKVAVAMVNWRRATDTLECIASLVEHSPFPLDLVVVDNGSNDGSAERIVGRFPQVRLIALERNEGYTVGINLAIEGALKGNPEFILVMNNDAVAMPGFLEPLLDVMDRRPRCGIAGPRILYHRSGLIWFGGGTYNQWLGYTRHQHMDKWGNGEGSEDVEREVDYITGCTALIRSDLFRQIGAYDEEFNIYFEDLEMSLRASEAGYENWYVPSSVTKHKVSASTGIAGENVLTPMRAYHYARNAMLVIGKRRRGLKAATSVAGQYLIAFPYHSLGILLSPHKRAMSSYLRGLWDGTLWLIRQGR